MTERGGKAAHARVILDFLAQTGVSHVIGLPDNGTAALLSLVDEHPTMRRLAVTREAEAFAIASGLWMGGRNPVVVIQNTGLLESGDSLRGTAARMGVPLLFFVSCRGYRKALARGMDPAAAGVDAETLTRPDLDSVAPMTEPTLTAWGIPHFRYRGDDDEPRLAAARALALREERPVAVLLTRSLS